MILHIFVGDLYVERLPKDVKFLKLQVRADRCREHAVSSDLYLSDNIVRFNQTMHFPVGEEENIINELDINLICLKNDSTEAVIGSCKFICTSGEHSITKTVTLNDHRGVLIGKVPITTFYYSSAIKLGDRVMFKPMYEPNAKEYAFLLSRRVRHSSKASPVTFDHNIEHQLNNDARDLINRDFKIVSSKSLNKKKPTPAPVKAPQIASSAPDSLTYNPGMTRNGTMSDAVRGRLHSKPAVPRASSAGTSRARTADSPKLRSTYMSVGYVKEKQWPERDTGEAERNLFRLHQASEMKLQLLKDIAYLAQQRNARTKARQDAIRRKKQRVEVQEGKIKRVLAKKESEIQLLKGTLTHLRLTSALRSAPAGPTSGTNSTAPVSTKASVPAFSRLQHLLYPNESDSTRRRASTPNLTSRSLPSTTVAATPSRSALKRPSSAPRSGARAANSRARGARKSGVSFRLTQPTVSSASAPPAPLYQPLSSGQSPYDTRRRPASASRVPSRRSAPTQEELVDQLSEAFDITFDDSDRENDRKAGQDSRYHHHEQANGASNSTSIAKDWLATARASINEHHRRADQNARNVAVAGHKNSAASTARRQHHSPASSPRLYQGIQDEDLYRQHPELRPSGYGDSPPSASQKDLRSSQRAAPLARQQSRPQQSQQQYTGFTDEDLYRQHPELKPSHTQVHRIPVPRAHGPAHQIASPGSVPHYPEDDVSTSSGESEEQHRIAQRAQEQASAVPGFLNSLVQAPAQNTDFDTTVSSIAVGDIPYFPTARKAVPSSYQDSAVGSRVQTSPTRSEHSTDSLDRQPEVAKHDNAPQKNGAATTSRRRAQPENIINLASSQPAAPARAPVSTRVTKQLERNQRYTALLQAQQQQGTQRFETSAPSATKPALSSAGNNGAPSAHRQPPQAMPPARTAPPAAPITSTSAKPSAPITTSAAGAAAVTAVGAEESGEDSFEDAQEYSLSATLAQNVAEVANTVQQLQSRVNTLQNKTQEDLVPPGWVRRTNPTVLATTSDAGATNGAAYPTPASQDPGNDIKIVFDEASSSSGEFDLVAHKTTSAVRN